jgi:hypothetical protein
MKPTLLLAVLFIRYDQQRGVEEYLLGFRLAHTVTIGILAVVARIPLELPGMFQHSHNPYMMPIYSSCNRAGRSPGSCDGCHIGTATADCGIADAQLFYVLIIRRNSASLPNQPTVTQWLLKRKSRASG